MKYIIIELNDFNQNYVANKFIHARNRNDVASLPSYFKGLVKASPTTAVPSVNYDCVSDEPNFYTDGGTRRRDAIR